jgi:ATP-dependent Clp protease ATP-binding subunit ClpA
VAGEILDSQIDRICNNLRTDKNIHLEISDIAKRALLDKAIGNLDNGGRGIGNIVESMLINPLSRYMFDNELFADCKIIIMEINADKAPYSLVCETA